MGKSRKISATEQKVREMGYLKINIYIDVNHPLPTGGWADFFIDPKSCEEIVKTSGIYKALEQKLQESEKEKIDDLANYILSSLKVTKIDSNIHPHYVDGKIHALIDFLGFIDKKYNTNYTSKIKINEIVI